MNRLRKFGTVPSIVVSSLIFALMHFDIPGFITIFLMGTLFGYLTSRYKSLVPSVILHFLNNLIAVFFNYFKDSVSEYMSENITIVVFMLEFASLLYVIIWLISSLINKFRNRRDDNYNEPQQGDSVDVYTRIFQSFKSVWMILLLVLSISIMLLFEFGNLW